MSWSATQYSKFEAERNRPIRDLLAQLPLEGVRTAADLGCGPGNSTELLLERYPNALITAMDSSSDMIDAARKRLPAVSFELADIATWDNPGPFDVILANASLQWVRDHAALLPKLVAKLSPGGALAIQMPDNYNEPAHQAMREIAANGPWKDKLARIGLAPRNDAAWYFGMLREIAGSVDVWRTTYHHPLPGGPAAVVEWFKGSGLRPFVDALEGEERAEYLARYQAAIAEAYTVFPDGTVLLPFPRLFIVATANRSAAESVGPR